MTTKPAPPEEPLGTRPRAEPRRTQRAAQLSPLARAALANGVAFEDVEAYVSGARVYNKPLEVDE